MEMRRIFVAVLAATIVAAFVAPAFGGKSSAEFGRELFTDPTLGGSTNEKSCESCHPGGQGLEKAAGNKNLSKMINQCITGPLQGTKIDGRSAEMRSLKLYIESLGSEASK